MSQTGAISPEEPIIGAASRHQAVRSKQANSRTSASIAENGPELLLQLVAAVAKLRCSAAHCVLQVATASYKDGTGTKGEASTR